MPAVGLGFGFCFGLASLGAKPVLPFLCSALVLMPHSPPRESLPFFRAKPMAAPKTLTAAPNDMVEFSGIDNFRAVVVTSVRSPRAQVRPFGRLTLP